MEVGIMNCEQCGGSNNGCYGSGRFCGKKCASAFSTFAKRAEINAKVSAKLKGKPNAGGKPFSKGYDPRRPVLGPLHWKKMNEARKKQLEEIYATSPWQSLPISEKRRRILAEQKGCCLGCGISDWLGKKLTLELHHIDGDKRNNDRENLCMLCPNCHSQTPNYRMKGKRIVTIDGVARAEKV